MVKVLFCRPDHDSTINYLHHFSKELVSLSQLHHDTLDKEGKRANKKEITEILIKKNPSLVMFNGHGAPNLICGHNNEPLIIMNENHSLLRDKITYSLSCSSGLLLGKKVAEEGKTCFIGYELDFALGRDPDSEATPSRDRIARLFLEPSNLLVSSLIKGNSVKDSINKARKKMKENVRFLSTTNEFPEAPHYAPYLFGNYMGLVCHGNSQSSIN